MKSTDNKSSNEIGKNQEFICGYTFGFNASRGELTKEESYASFDAMIQETKANHVILAIRAMQDTPQSTYVDYISEETPSLQEVDRFVEYIHSKGIQVILKPMINVRNGTWRAHISFFDEDVPGEPTWSEWFESYTKFQVAYAKIAEKHQCKMLIVGCEMVQSDRREAEWRNLIREVRKEYKGLITYNADKYQEDRVLWWDELDVISSSGYYPMEELSQEFDRIEAVVKTFRKPFFFAEAGCMSTTGSSKRPNNWMVTGESNQEEQACYYDVFFKEVDKYPFIQGVGLWDWSINLSQNNAYDYSTYQKMASSVISKYFEKRQSY
jgi:hypothetical protein